MQGDQAPKLIAQRIEEINLENKASIIVLTRGGGDKKELATFNSIEIAEAICKSKIPIVTGIGHQRDKTIADRVADHYTYTPTDVAYKLAHLSDNLPPKLQETQNPAQSIQTSGVSPSIIIAIIAVGLVGVAILLMLLLQG